MNFYNPVAEQCNLWSKKLLVTERKIFSKDYIYYIYLYLLYLQFVEYNTINLWSGLQKKL
jgi:hypothetical protein